MKSLSRFIVTSVHGISVHVFSDHVLVLNALIQGLYLGICIVASGPRHGGALGRRRERKRDDTEGDECRVQPADFDLDFIQL